MNTHADIGTPILMDLESAHVPAKGHMDVFTHTHPDAWDVTNHGTQACTDLAQGCLHAILTTWKIQLLVEANQRKRAVGQGEAWVQNQSSEPS